MNTCLPLLDFGEMYGYERNQSVMTNGPETTWVRTTASASSLSLFLSFSIFLVFFFLNSNGCNYRWKCCNRLVWFGEDELVSVGYFFSFSSSHALVIIWGWLQLTEWSQTETYRRDVLTKKERKRERWGIVSSLSFSHHHHLSLLGVMVVAGQLPNSPTVLCD